MALEPESLVAAIDEDEQRRTSAPPPAPRRSLLGRSDVAAVCFVVFAATAAWGWGQMKEPVPAPAPTREGQVAATRELLVRVRLAVEQHRAGTGSYPEDVAAVTGPDLAAHVAYLQDDAGFQVAALAGDEFVWLASEDDVEAFLKDGSHVPAGGDGAAPAVSSPPAP